MGLIDQARQPGPYAETENGKLDLGAVTRWKRRALVGGYSILIVSIALFVLGFIVLRGTTIGAALALIGVVIGYEAYLLIRRAQGVRARAMTSRTLNC